MSNGGKNKYNGSVPDVQRKGVVAVERLGWQGITPVAAAASVPSSLIFYHSLVSNNNDNN